MTGRNFGVSFFGSRDRYRGGHETLDNQNLESEVITELTIVHQQLESGLAEGIGTSTTAIGKGTILKRIPADR